MRRARCSCMIFGAIARAKREDLMQKNVARNASRWNGSQLQEDERELLHCNAMYIDNVTRGKFELNIQRKIDAENIVFML